MNLKVAIMIKLRIEMKFLYNVTDVMNGYKFADNVRDVTR